MAIDDETIGRNIRRLREEKALSQAELADSLLQQGIRGMHPQTITKLESGSRALKFNEAIALAAVLGVSIGELALLASWEEGALADLDVKIARAHFRRSRASDYRVMLEDQALAVQGELERAREEDRVAGEAYAGLLAERKLMKMGEIVGIPAGRTKAGRALAEQMKGVSDGEHQEAT